MGRCVYLLVFSPWEGGAVKSADLVFSGELRPWLHMVHSQSPGSRVLLVCTHAESPPPGADRGPWKETLARLCGDVKAKVPRTHTSSNHTCASSRPYTHKGI